MRAPGQLLPARMGVAAKGEVGGCRPLEPKRQCHMVKSVFSKGVVCLTPWGWLTSQKELLRLLLGAIPSCHQMQGLLSL